MMNLNRGVVLLLGLLLFINTQTVAQRPEDDFISLVKSAGLYPQFEENYRILILNLMTHPDSYYKRDEEKTYLVFKVINREYQMVLDEAALDSSFLNFQLLVKSAYGRRSYYRLEKGELVECWYKERGVTFSNNTNNYATTYSLNTGYYDFVDYIEEFNSFLVQKRVKNIRSKQLRRAHRMVNSIRDTQYSRLVKMINKYDKFVAKRLRKQDKKRAKAKKKFEKEKKKEEKTKSKKNKK